MHSTTYNETISQVLMFKLGFPNSEMNEVDWEDISRQKTFPFRRQSRRIPFKVTSL